MPSEIIIEIDKVDFKNRLNIKDGYTPIKGVDYFDGKTPTETELSELIKPLIPEPLSGSPDSPTDIKNKLESLNEGKRLDYDKLDNTPDIPTLIRKIGGGSASSKTVSLIELDDVDYSGLTKTNGKYVLGGGAAGTLAQTLILGNATGGTSIAMTAGDFITGSSGAVQQDMASGAFTVTTDGGAFATPYHYVNTTKLDLVGLGGGEIALNLGNIDISHNTLIKFNTAPVRFNALTASTVPYLDASKNLVSSAVTPTQLSYLDATSSIQTQLNAKAPSLGADDNYVTDAQLVVITNTSGTNTGDVTVLDSAEIDLTLTGQQISASLVAGSIDETKLDVSTNASLDLADSAVQNLGDLGITATATELNYVDGVTSAIQTQIDGKQPIDSDLTSWAGVTRATGFDTFVATPSSANLASLVTGETGSGALVFGTSPTFTTQITTPKATSGGATLTLGDSSGTGRIVLEESTGLISVGDGIVSTNGTRIKGTITNNSNNVFGVSQGFDVTSSGNGTGGVTIAGFLRPTATLGTGYGTIARVVIADSDASSSDVTNLHSYFNRIDTSAGYTGTITSANNFTITDANVSGGSVTNLVGLNVENLSAGTSINRAVVLNLSSGTNKHNIYAQGTADNYFAGNVGIGDSTPSYQLELSTDSAAKPSTNTWTIASDRRLKKNIEPYIDGLEKILAVNPIRYEYNGKGKTKDGTKGIGVVSDEISQILPDSVSKVKVRLNETDTEDTEVDGFNSHELTYLLINAVKELSERIKVLEK